MKKISIVILAMIVCASLLGGCGDESKLLGKWKRDSSGGSIWMYSFPRNIEFFEDNKLSADHVGGDYTIEDGKLVCNISYANYAYEYEISGDTLILTLGGKDEEYTRQ